MTSKGNVQQIFFCFMAVEILSGIFWVMILYSLTGGYHHLRDTQCLLFKAEVHFYKHQGSLLVWIFLPYLFSDWPPSLSLPSSNPIQVLHFPALSLQHWGWGQHVSRKRWHRLVKPHSARTQDNTNMNCHFQWSSGYHACYCTPRCAGSNLEEDDGFWGQ
jgi:hypothetical protein